MTEEMKAGRELDALVAEKVFGAVVDGERSSIDPDSPDCWRETPRFSTDIAAAWTVIGARPLGVWSWQLTQDDSGVWWASINLGFRTSYTKGVVAFGDTAPLAICLAALKAVSA